MVRTDRRQPGAQDICAREGHCACYREGLAGARCCCCDERRSVLVELADRVCTACGGTRRFRPVGKSQNIEVDCPRCTPGSSVEVWRRSL